MKIKLPVAGCRLQVPRWSQATCKTFNLQPSTFNRAREGVALVITLILLSVTLVMAVAFLAISRRERNSVTTSTATATTRLATDSALAAAQAQIAASVLAAPAAAYDYHLLVSTNYVDGFNSYFDPTTGQLWGGANLEYAVSNQLVLPRAPVFVATNGGNGLDFRYYLDLNRNGHFEDSGLVPDVDNAGFTNGFINAAGDPQWIGVLEHPDQFHGPNNRFLSRYAFFAQPLGNSLDLNHIYNQTRQNNLSVASDGFFRNEGVGTWELNLAAFLADLNTNIWDPPTTLNAANNPYNYQQPFFPNTGAAFEDARALLAYRYNYDYNSLDVPSALMNLAISGAGIDGYTLGNLMTTPSLPVPLGNNLHWAGSDNTNRFYTLMSDLFDPTKSSPNFTNRLTMAGNSAFSQATYDRYTLYRLLDQLGTDSTVDDTRMNLNYDNLDASGNVIPGAETNCIPWTPLRFFTNAADRIVRAYTAQWYAANPTNFLMTYYGWAKPNYYIGSDGYGLTNFPYNGMTNQVPSFGLTDIPVYVGGQFVYTPAVNRLLQLAANMYDASTNVSGLAGNNGHDYPSVFRPTFNVLNQNGFKNVYIDGFQYIPTVTGTTDPILNNVANVQDLVLGHVTRNVYGVPWIVGAKKDFPMFNQFYMLNAVQVTRKLLVSKPFFGANVDTFTTNQMYVFSISNSLGCSFWNSYTNNYKGNPTVVVNGYLSMVLTNDSSPAPLAQFNNVYYGNSGSPFTTNIWPGTSWGNVPPYTSLNSMGCFATPVQLTATLLTNSIYRYGSPGYFDSFNTDYQTTVNTPALPHFGLQTTNRLQAYIFDGTPGNYHVIDYVQFAGPEGTRDLSAELADPGIGNGNSVYLWSTNPVTANPYGTPWGVPNQILVSLGPKYATPMNSSPNFWVPPPNLPAYLPKTQAAEQGFFQGFFNVNRLQYGWFQVNNKGPYYTNTELSVQAPYTPTRMMYDYQSWQANDPLVHQLASELAYNIPGETGVQVRDDPNNFLPQVTIGTLSKTWSPWGKNHPLLATSTRTYVDGTWQTALKDSLIWRPDNWDFPTYKLPTPGWLGRVHRGTPWQTVYLKSTDITGMNGNAGANSWAAWTGDTRSVNNNYFDANNAAPWQDTWLFDLFTTQLNGNAVKGALSVNQTHLAAWSAVLSGVVALTNAGPSFIGYVASPVVTNTIVQPAGVDGTNSPLGQIVTSINNTRANFVNPDGVKGVFEHTGDVLRSLSLSEHSPLLNWNDANQQQNSISDEMYEWLPQQVMGLLRVSSAPRYVVYCYGQTLQPAPNGLVLSGPNFGLCTNYQITAESAARAIVRLDKHVTASGTNYTTTVENYTVLPP